LILPVSRPGLGPVIPREPLLLFSGCETKRTQKKRCDRGAPLRRRVTITDGIRPINRNNADRCRPAWLCPQVLQEGHALLNRHRRAAAMNKSLIDHAQFVESAITKALEPVNGVRLPTPGLAFRAQRSKVRERYPGRANPGCSAICGRDSAPPPRPKPQMAAPSLTSSPSSAARTASAVALMPAWWRSRGWANSIVWVPVIRPGDPDSTMIRSAR
jgi:hypothetical protein